MTVPVAVLLRRNAKRDANSTLTHLSRGQCDRFIRTLQQLAFINGRLIEAVKFSDGFFTVSELESLVGRDQNPLSSSEERVYWIQEVSRLQRNEYDAWARNELGPNFTVTVRDPETGQVRPSSGDEDVVNVLAAAAPPLENTNRYWSWDVRSFGFSEFREARICDGP